MRRAPALLAAVLLAGGATIALAQAGQDVDPETVAAQEQGAAEQPAGRPPAPPPITLRDRPGASPGEALYVDKCIMCHDANGMGTGLLARDRPVALLEARDNLTVQFVIVAARQGIGNMPAIPRGEASDEELQLIAEYLAGGPYLSEGEAP